MALATLLTLVVGLLLGPFPLAQASPDLVGNLPIFRPLAKYMGESGANCS